MDSLLCIAAYDVRHIGVTDLINQAMFWHVLSDTLCY